MSEHTDQIVQPVNSPALMTRSERKHLLVLACTVDRAAWKRACYPAHRKSPAMQIMQRILPHLDALSFLLPGKLGGLLRSANFFAQLGRQFGWLKIFG